MHPDPNGPTRPDSEVSLVLFGSHPRGLSVPRREALLGNLPAAVDLLGRRRAGEIPEADIDAYVSLQWMRWNGGTLALTSNGQSLVDLVTARHPA
jgi:hypothetical protein